MEQLKTDITEVHVSQILNMYGNRNIHYINVKIYPWLTYIGSTYCFSCGIVIRCLILPIDGQHSVFKHSLGFCWTYKNLC